VEVPQLHELLLALVDVGEFVYHHAGLGAQPLGISLAFAVHVELLGLDRQARRRVVVQPVQYRRRIFTKYPRAQYPSGKQTVNPTNRTAVKKVDLSQILNIHLKLFRILLKPFTSVHLQVNIKGKYCTKQSVELNKIQE